MKTGFSFLQLVVLFVFSVAHAEFPNFIPKGPSDISYVHRQVRADTRENSKLNGPVSAIAIHPNDDNILLVGTSNGGIWRANSKSKNSFDQVSQSGNSLTMCNSITSIAFSPSGKTVIAGCGAVSSSWLSQASGIIISRDDGLTWRQTSFPLFWLESDDSHDSSDDSSDGRAETRYNSALSVYGVALVDDNTIVAAVATPPNQKIDSNREPPVGIYRSTDGGATWNTMEKGDHFTDLVQDPTDPKVLYAGSPSMRGVVKSTDGGRSWRSVVSGLSSNTIRVRLAIAPSSPKTVYVAVLGKTQSGLGYSRTDFEYFYDYDSKRDFYDLTDLWMTSDGGSKFQRISPLPETTERSLSGKNFRFGLFTVGHADYNFAIAVHPKDASMVYVAGDLEIGSLGGSGISAVGSSGPGARIFRSEIKSGRADWKAMVASFTDDNSWPAAGALTLAFDSDEVLWYGSLGGLYTHSDPTSSNGEWSYAGADIEASEVRDFGYFNKLNQLVVGLQDNGFAVGHLKKADRWVEITDGNAEAVIVDTRADYFLIKRAGEEFIGGEEFVFAKKDDSNDDDRNGLRKQQVDQDLTFTRFVPLNTRYRINTQNPNLIAMFRDNVLAELDFNQLSQINIDGKELDYPNPEKVLQLEGLVGVKTITAVHYGGLNDNIPWPRVLYIGARFHIEKKGRLYRRDRFGDVYLTAWDFGTPMAITTNPDELEDVWAIDDTGRVFRSLNGGLTWTEMTFNLPALPVFNEDQYFPVTMSILNVTGSDWVFVGSTYGVYVRALNSPSQWMKTNIPAITSKLRIDSENQMVYAATLGRGLWAWHYEVPVESSSSSMAALSASPLSIWTMTLFVLSFAFFWQRM